MQKNKITLNNQRGIVALAVAIPFLLVSLGFVIAAPMFIISNVQTLSVSNVYQNLFGTDASGVSYTTPNDVVLGKGDKALNVPCIKQDGGLQCGVASTAMVLAFLTGKTYSTTQLLNSSGGFKAGDNSVDIEGLLENRTGAKWERVGWDFNRIKRSIDQNLPVIIYSTYKGGTRHIMVIRGYKNDGKFIVNSSNTNNCQTWFVSPAEFNQWGGHTDSGKVMIIASKVN